MTLVVHQSESPFIKASSLELKTTHLLEAKKLWGNGVWSCLPLPGNRTPPTHPKPLGSMVTTPSNGTAVSTNCPWRRVLISSREFGSVNFSRVGRLQRLVFRSFMVHYPNKHILPVRWSRAFCHVTEITWNKSIIFIYVKSRHDTLQTIRFTWTETPGSETGFSFGIFGIVHQAWQWLTNWDVGGNLKHPIPWHRTSANLIGYSQLISMCWKTSNRIKSNQNTFTNRWYSLSKL